MRQGPYRQRFDLANFRERFRRRLSSRVALRLHMTLIVTLIFAAALVTSRAALLLGVNSMALRYFAAVCVGYALFFGLLRAWIWTLASHLESEAPEHSPEAVAFELAPDAVPDPLLNAPAFDAALRPDDPGFDGRRAAEEDSVGIVDIPDFSGGSSTSSGGGGGSLDLGDPGEGIIAILLLAVIAIVAAIVFGAAVYFIWEAPAILGEAALEAVLASVLLRAGARISRPGWEGSVFKASRLPAGIVLVVATFGGFLAQDLCPQASTLPGVIKQCVMEKPAKP